MEYAPSDRKSANPIIQSYETIPLTYGQRIDHIEAMSYGELLDFASVSGIGHPYFDARYAYFTGTVVPHFRKLYKGQTRSVRKDDFERAERLGLLDPSILRRFKRQIAKIDRAIAMWFV